MSHAPRMATPTAPLAFFTICSKNFLAYARTLAASVREHHSGARMYVALCDRVDDLFDPAAEPFELLPLESLAIPGIEGMVERYNITELNTSIKPFVFEHLFTQRNETRVVYLDPDILVVSPLAEVDARLGVDTDAILTPHVLQPAEGVEIDDIKMLQLGVFNLGFVALHGTDRVRAIVQWWGRRLERQCVIDVPNGLFVDQKWANLLPSFIPRTLVLSHPGYNVAYWNLPQRRVVRVGREWTVNGQPLVFFHFSGNDLANDQVFSRHSPSITMAAAGDAALLLAEYRSRVFANGHADVIGLPYAFSWGGPSGHNAHTPERVGASPTPSSQASLALSPFAAPLPSHRRTFRRARDAWVTMRRARDHAGGWVPMLAKAAGVLRRGGLGLVRATVRELNARQGRSPGVGPSVPAVALAPVASSPAMGADIEAVLEARWAGERARSEQACEARVQRARDETAAYWSQQVVKARAEVAAELSNRVRAVHAQVAAHWSDQLSAADATSWRDARPTACAAAAPRAMAPLSPTQRPRIALMSHDAQAHGAQYLALNLLRELVQMGVEVETLMQGPGWLEPQFEALAPLHRLYTMDGDAQHALAAELRRRGIDRVIANTTVCGCAITAFRDAGFRIVSLIHELPGLIAHYGLEEALVVLTDASSRVVVPSQAVRDGLVASLGADRITPKLAMRPQGLFTRNRHRGLADTSGPRARLRERLGLASDAMIALSVGYADSRKGADLLADALLRASARAPGFQVVWVGHADEAIRASIESRLGAAGLAGRFHFVGLDFDTDDYYAGADVYALASREDPFPSVVMESLAVGTPVVAFAGTGGGADLVDGRAGFAVPAFDVDAYADALLRVAGDRDLAERLGAAGRDLIDREFGFRRYALDLLAMAGVDVPQVSAVVPNYNYARYLPERIDSIAGQSAPMAEIIVLDDASTDDSIEIVRTQRLYTNPEPVIVASTTNSGSVFRQWLAGARRAAGEFVWIAEADDVAEPLLVETLVRAMRADRDIVMAYAQSSRVDAAGIPIAADYLGYTDDLDRDRWRAPYTVDGAEEVERALAVKNTIPNVSAVLFRRDALLDVLETHIDALAGYRVAGDWVTYLHLLRRGRIHFEPAVLNRHRYHGASVTGALELRRHHDEVVAAQALAQRLFTVSPRARSAAAAYADALRSHFGLAGER